MKHVVLLGDRNVSYLTHRELDASLNLLPAEVRAYWVDTDSPDAGRVSGADGLWVVPGSPYRDDAAVYAAITGARTSVELLVAHGLTIGARAADAGVEAIELAEHPFFMATLFQPQMGSVEGRPLHPVLRAFMAAI